MAIEERKGWIGVDLDGTLAHYDDFHGLDHIGQPIPAVLARVKEWIADGIDVRIFTARANPIGLKQSEYVAGIAAIERWCIEHIGRELPITCTKDYAMHELWDDRCVCVERNTGRILGRNSMGAPASEEPQDWGEPTSLQSLDVIADNLRKENRLYCEGVVRSAIHELTAARAEIERLQEELEQDTNPHYAAQAVRFRTAKEKAEQELAGRLRRDRAAEAAIRTEVSDD